MTDAEWDACDDPAPMLTLLRGEAEERKLRLFAAACCRGVWVWLADVRGRRAVEVAERFADGGASEDELRAACGGAGVAEYDEAAGGESGWEGEARERALSAAYWAAAHADVAARAVSWGGDVTALAASRAAEAGAWADPTTDGAGGPGGRGAQAGLVRCVFGNPFRPLTAGPAWRTATALSLARAAYEERHLPSGHLDAARLLVLADALEEAGATDARLLGHLRSAGPHVRGCHAVDAVLGQS